MPFDHCHELGAELGRKPRSGVDQHRHLALGGHREDCFDPRMRAHRKRLGARVQLDASRSGVQGPFGLGHRILGRVEPAERNQPPPALGSPIQHPIVRHAVGRLAIGIVQRKGDRPLGRGRIKDLDQLGRCHAHAVLVHAEVGVHVDHLDAGGAKLLGAAGVLLHHPGREVGHQAGSRASIALDTRSRTSSEPIRSSTSSKNPRTISRSAWARVRPRAIR